jgi:N-dimethylarginine dimethylaminohydrolase
MAPASEQKIIDMAKAHEQHDTYVQLLRGLLHDVIEVPADHKHPGEHRCVCMLMCLIT